MYIGTVHKVQKAKKQKSKKQLQKTANKKTYPSTIKAM